MPNFAVIISADFLVNMNRKHAISKTFARAYAGYDAAADIQAASAHLLTQKLMEIGLAPALPQILEIGCGTGLLTDELYRAGLAGGITISDLSADIVERTARRFPGCLALAMDGEDPALRERRFDLVVGNLVAQWFSDLGASLARLCRLLKAGGYLAVTLLGPATFSEWRRLLPKDNPAFIFPSIDEIAALAPGKIRMLETITLKKVFADGIGFLQHLHALGAQQPMLGYQPMSAKDLRQAIASLEREKPVTITYDLVFLILGNDHQPPSPT